MSEPTTLAELQRRLVYTLLQPAVAMCRRFSMSLDVLEQLARLAYFEELRGDGGLTQAEVARIFGRSRRTVVGVERQFQSDFLAPARDVGIDRQLEEALAMGPLTAAEVAERVREALELDEVEERLETLARAGRARVTSDGGVRRYLLQHRFQSLVRDDMLARIDGLRHQLGVLAAAVRARFVRKNGDHRPSAARTVSFLGTAADVEAMASELIRAARLRAIDVEENALTEGGYERYAVTLAVAPLEEHE